jgi:hypothetical protein
MTADVQTAAYVAAHGSSANMVFGFWPGKKKSEIPALAPFKRPIQAYRNFLNSLELYNIRATFDIVHGKDLFKFPMYPTQNQPANPHQPIQTKQLEDPFDNYPFEHHVKCGFCHQDFNFALRVKDLSQNLNLVKKETTKNQFLDCCPKCSKPSITCAVCLLPIKLFNPHKEVIKSDWSNLN